jgi:hypothetical protein
MKNGFEFCIARFSIAEREVFINKKGKTQAPKQ